MKFKGIYRKNMMLWLFCNYCLIIDSFYWLMVNDFIFVRLYEIIGMCLRI